MEPGLVPREVPNGSGSGDKCEELGWNRVDMRTGRIKSVTEIATVDPWLPCPTMF